MENALNELKLRLFFVCARQFPAMARAESPLGHTVACRVDRPERRWLSFAAVTDEPRPKIKGDMTAASSICGGFGNSETRMRLRMS
jgi:hypothetical protein